MLLAFDGLSGPVALIDSDELAGCMAAVLRGWRFRELVDRDAPAPVITVRRFPKGYRIESLWRSSPAHHKDRVDAACTLIVDLIWASIANDPSLLCLHGAAAEFGGRLVVFPTPYRSGKSTLAVYMAAAGVRLYADDVLPIKAGRELGVAPGILPRLRLPLPKNASAAVLDFVDRRRGLGNRRYLYLDLRPDELASRGTEAPIGGFVLLNRDPKAPPGLAPASDSEVLRRTVLQNFARDVEATDILGRLTALVAASRCFKLTYADGEQAVALLKQAFDRWPSRPGHDTPRPTRDPARAAVSDVAQDDGGTLYRRNPKVTETAIDGDAFLVNPDSQGIYHLNAVGAALWRLLAEPTSVEHAASLLHEAFPEVSRKVIERDIAALMGTLSARGLVTGTE